MPGTRLAVPIAGRERAPRSGFAAPPRRRVRVGLVNNMSDSALLTTERQFTGLLGPHVDLHLFYFPETERGEPARRRLAERYHDIVDLPEARLDGLIVTGAEPRAAHLREEPYWPSLQRLVDWALASTASTLWSCLAAHAAVLHLDGVERRPLDQKCSGVFERTLVGDHPLNRGLPERSWAPHSRHNTLDETDLVRAGYTLLSRADGAGVDAFAREGPSRFVFLQGHPEYDPDSLGLEFQRDFNRFLRGQSVRPPPIPLNLFSPEAEKAIGELVAEAGPSPSSRLAGRLAALVGGEALRARWRPSAEAFYAGWMDSLRSPATLSSAVI